MALGLGGEGGRSGSEDGAWPTFPGAAWDTPGGDGRERAERPETPKEEGRRWGEGVDPNLGADFMEAGGNILGRGVAPEDMALQHLSQLVLCHVGKFPAGEAKGRKAGHGMPGECWAKPLRWAGVEAAKRAPRAAIPMFLPAGEALAERRGGEGCRAYLSLGPEAKQRKTRAGTRGLAGGGRTASLPPLPRPWSDYDSPPLLK